MMKAILHTSYDIISKSVGYAYGFNMIFILRGRVDYSKALQWQNLYLG